MTQEDKELLLVDLRARLPYEVMLKIGDHSDYKFIGIVITDEYPMKVVVVENGIPYKIEVPLDIIKPYLRPMSSMTEEEREELRQEQIKDEQLFTDCIKNHPERRGLIIPHFAADWCDKNMFDYRELIPRGLAIEVTEENNPYKD